MPLVDSGPGIGPNETHVYSTSPNGTIITMDITIDPANAPRYLELASAVALKFRAEPECTFCELSQHPDDKGRIRILHGWTKDSEWWRQSHMGQKYFREFMNEVSKMWIKPRTIEHFDRIPAEG